MPDSGHPGRGTAGLRAEIDPAGGDAVRPVPGGGHRSGGRPVAQDPQPVTRKRDRNSPCTHPAYRGNRRLWGSISAVQQLPQLVEEGFFPEGVDLEEHGLTAACGYC